MIPSWGDEKACGPGEFDTTAYAENPRRKRNIQVRNSPLSRIRICAVHLLILILITTSVWAKDDNPYKKFDASKRFTDNTQLKWRLVSKASEECQKESRRRGLGGFPYEVEACSFWSKSAFLGGHSCTIITDKMTNSETVTHEIRHCFSGNYHR